MPTKINTEALSLVGEGEYHNVYRVCDENNRYYALKIPKVYSEAPGSLEKNFKYWTLFNPDLPAELFNGPKIFWAIGRPPRVCESNHIHLYREKKQLKAMFLNNEGTIQHAILTNLSHAKDILYAIKEDYSILSFEQEFEIRQALKVDLRGLYVPFIDGHSHSEMNALDEQEVAQALLHYWKTIRCIIHDFNSDGNLIKEHSTGKIRCVDFDEITTPLACSSKMVGFYKPEEPEDRYERERRFFYSDRPKTLGTHINLVLLYIEKYLKHDLFPISTLNQYITMDVMKSLMQYEKDSIPLTLEMLKELACDAPISNEVSSKDSLHYSPKTP
ncbi:MAG: hypothetical protein CK423_08045 [Legionella sp.]|nr:MAG: hypothetical protein CK423_08045 [Legionella sp.]